MSGPVRPAWAATEAKGPGALLAFAAGPGGGPRVQVWNGTVMSADFFAYEDTQRGGVNVAWTTAGVLLTGPGPGGGPALKAFDAFGHPVAVPGDAEGRPAVWVGDPNDKRGFVPVPVDVVREVPTPVPIPVSDYTLGRPADRNSFRVWLDWRTRVYYGASKAVVDALWTWYGPAGNVCLSVGRAPPGPPGSYGTVIVGFDLTAAGKTPGEAGEANLGLWVAPDGKPVDLWQSRPCYVDSDGGHLLDALAVAVTCGHEMLHAFGWRHEDSPTPGVFQERLDIVRPAASRAAGLVLGARA